MAREEKSLTLDELQAITRIQKRYLSAIEEGNFEVMPGKFYTRAFIKQYAEAVDLEPEVLFEEYKNEIPIAYEDDLPEQLTRVQSRNSVSRKGSKLIEFFPKILMAIFFIAIIVLVWYLVTNFLISNDKDAVNDEPNTSIDISESDDVPSTDSSADDKGNEGQTDSTDQEKKDDDQSEEDKEQDAQTITVENVAGNTTTYEVSDMSQYEVTVKATDSGEAWIEVTNNSDKQYASKKIANGESETYDFSEDIEAYIRTGRAMDTEIYVNDEKLEFESEATVQNIIIKFNKQQ